MASCLRVNTTMPSREDEGHEGADEGEDVPGGEAERRQGDGMRPSATSNSRYFA